MEITTSDGGPGGHGCRLDVFKPNCAPGFSVTRQRTRVSAWIELFTKANILRDIGVVDKVVTTLRGLIVKRASHPCHATVGPTRDLVPVLVGRLQAYATALPDPNAELKDLFNTSTLPWVVIVVVNSYAEIRCNTYPAHEQLALASITCFCDPRSGCALRSICMENSHIEAHNWSMTVQGHARNEHSTAAAAAAASEAVEFPASSEVAGQVVDCPVEKENCVCQRWQTSTAKSRWARRYLAPQCYSIEYMQLLSSLL